MPSLTVEVIDSTKRLPAPALAWLTDHVQKAIHHVGAAGEVRVRVVDDAEMTQAHAEFSDIAETTDVLTFDMTDPEAGPAPPMDLELGRLQNVSLKFVLDTDILACLDVASRQSQGDTPAKGPRYPVEKELLLYVVHGVLHCLGMDDHDEAAAASMHRVEDAVLTAIGVGPVYSSGR